MKSGTGTACGKAILVGEHFVLWGGTALAFPVRSASLSVTVRCEDARRTVVAAPQGELLALAAKRGLRYLGFREKAAFSVEVASGFPHSAGLGASAAFSVAFCRAVLSLVGAAQDDDLVAQASFEMEKVFHRHPSGIDSTTIAFETPTFVKTGRKFFVKKSGRSRGPLAGFLDIPDGAVFLLADSGQRCATRDAVDKVSSLADTPDGARVLEKLTGVAEAIALQTASALRKGDFQHVGDMMNENHYLLKALGVSTDRLDLMRETALHAGALGAKLTGAGGGGFLLVLAAPDAVQDIRDALTLVGVKTILEETT